MLWLQLEFGWIRHLDSHQSVWYLYPSPCTIVRNSLYLHNVQSFFFFVFWPVFFACNIMYGYGSLNVSVFVLGGVGKWIKCFVGWSKSKHLKQMAGTKQGKQRQLLKTRRENWLETERQKEKLGFLSILQSLTARKLGGVAFQIRSWSHQLQLLSLFDLFLFQKQNSSLLPNKREQVTWKSMAFVLLVWFSYLLFLVQLWCSIIRGFEEKSLIYFAWHFLRLKC